jgi:hypothetical protein
LTPLALPAVTEPPGRTTGLSLASASSVVSRGCSGYLLKTGQLIYSRQYHCDELLLIVVTATIAVTKAMHDNDEDL